MQQAYFEQGGRNLILRGVNLADAKLPPLKPTYRRESLSTETKCSYVDSPFSLSDAPSHLEKLRFLGFSVLRIPVVWEALEHDGPGIYDDEYIEYLTQLVRICVDHGFKVIINPHQDLWSRHVGGSGAPLWTLHACGLDPDFFASTHAAIRYSEWPVDDERKAPEEIPAMMWTTNHNRLATSTLFALFFGGRDFAPKCVIDGMNIQDYLQKHYLAAYSRLAEKLGTIPFAYDGMNEPEPGYIGWSDLNKLEREGTAKIGSTPTPIQSMRLGMGMKQEVDNYRLGSTGPHKSGTMTIAPKRGCWLEKDDPRWGWKRADSWPVNRCVWALHGVWDPETGELTKPDYFSRLPETSNVASKAENESEEPLSFVSSYWHEYHASWSRMLRQYTDKAYIMMQPSVFTPPPPNEEPMTAYSPHFYDGLTVMRRKWHDFWNADVIGLLRGRYRSKIAGLRVGRRNVRKVLSEQIGQLARDARLPTIVGETGIPFNLEEDRAFHDGNYSDHVKAMDALLSACDDHLLGYCIWAYSAVNDHRWGDQWNGEDLSIFCAETGSFPQHPYLANFRAAAAWCRPYVQSLVGQPVSMSFDHTTSVFEVEVEVESGDGGDAVVYVPWLHYRRSEELPELAIEVHVSEGDWSLDAEAQTLHWRYERGGRLRLSREQGPLSPRELGTIVS